MKWIDKFGMWASGICGIHCIVFPFLFVFFPMLTFLHSEVFEMSFLALSLVIAFFAMLQGYVYHKKAIPAIVAAIGFAIFIGAHKFWGEHLGLLLVGVGCIWIAHYINHQFTHSCKLDHKEKKHG